MTKRSCKKGYFLKFYLSLRLTLIFEGTGFGKCCSVNHLLTNDQSLRKQNQVA